MNKALVINSNKAVLLSIKKQWLEKILSGEKTIEVRKTMPWEISYPFVVFCYETKANGGAGKVTAVTSIHSIACVSFRHMLLAQKSPKRPLDSSKTAALPRTN